jgi:hypothetical protein
VRKCKQTFIFSYVLERKRQAGVFALDDAHFAKGSFADDAQQPKVVEIHCVVVRLAPSVRHRSVAGADPMQQGP